MNSTRTAALAAVVIFTAGCGPGAPAGSAEGASGRAQVRIVFVTHGQTSDPFWSVVANGARDAASDLGVRVEYQSPPSFDMVGMSNLIEAALASRPSGLVVSVPDAGALGPAIRAVIAAGVPVLSINSGAEVWRELGVLAHVGQTEYEAGALAGERLSAAGVTRAVCVNQEVGNAALDLRCRGFADALARAGASVRTLAVDLADPEDARQRIGGALRAQPPADGLLTLGPLGAAPALSALRESGRADVVRFATFDLSPEVLAAIEAGDVLFAVDQQQYLQGYLPVVLLTKYLETGALPGGGEVIRTGPGFVTSSTAAAVAELTARGIR